MQHADPAIGGYNSLSLHDAWDLLINIVARLKIIWNYQEWRTRSGKIYCVLPKELCI